MEGPKGTNQMRLNFSNSFRVMPEHCNFRFPQIFGGAFMAQLDLCAHTCCTDLLQFSDSPCDNAATYKVLELTFHLPCGLGDEIHMDASVVSMKDNSVVVHVE